MLLAKAFYQRIFFKECARLKHKQLWWRCNYRNIPKCMQIEGREESQGQGLFFRLNGLTQYRYWIRNCLSMSGQDCTEIYVWIWRVDFGTLEGNYTQTGAIGRQIFVVKNSEEVYETLIEGPIQSRPVWAKLVCPPNSNVVQCGPVLNPKLK